MTQGNEQKILYQTDSRIALLEKSVSLHEREITEIKQNHREMMRLLFDKIDGMKKDVHNLSLSNKDIVINQQKESNKNKMLMLTLLLGFVAQTITGIFLFVLNKGGI